MALMKSSNIPKDAVVLDEMEAVGYVWDVVDNWESLSDTWALHYGAVALGGVSSLSGLIVNKHYRRRFKLGSLGYMSSSLPIVILPGILTLLLHKQFVTTKVLLMRDNTCPICHEVRSGALQLAIGIGYPMLLGPTSALMYANRYATYRVPQLTDGAKAMLNFLLKHTKPFTGTLTYLAGLHLAVSAAVTYFEMKNNITLTNKLIEIEKKLDSDGFS